MSPPSARLASLCANELTKDDSVFLLLAGPTSKGALHHYVSTHVVLTCEVCKKWERRVPSRAASYKLERLCQCLVVIFDQISSLVWRYSILHAHVLDGIEYSRAGRPGLLSKMGSGAEPGQRLQSAKNSENQLKHVSDPKNFRLRRTEPAALRAALFTKKHIRSLHLLGAGPDRYRHRCVTA